MGGFMHMFSQFFPPKPTFTEEHIPDLKGKIFIVTGSNTGIGKEVAQVLYTKNAKVYLAGRSEQKYLTAMETMKKAAPTSIGELVFLRLDLADLSSVKASAEEFLSKESKLDVLINNAGLQAPPQGSKSAQGYDLQVGVNNLGPFLFTKLLTPILQQTASSQPANTVRVVWLSSAAAELNSHRPGGIDLDNLDYQVEKPPMIQYSISKAGSYLQATEYAKRVKPHGIVSVPINPGNITSELQRHLPTSFKLMTRPMLRPTKYGAYTELFAALSPEVTLEKTGQRVLPWGRYAFGMREDIENASKSVAEGGTGGAEKFWEWNEEQVKPFW